MGAKFFREDDQDLTPYAQRLKSSGAENVVIPTGNSALGAKAVVALDAVGFEPLAVLFNFGAISDGYCYDYGRTVFFGEPDASFQDIFRLIMASQEAGRRPASG